MSVGLDVHARSAVALFLAVGVGREDDLPGNFT
jgi:hypothetical protein